MYGPKVFLLTEIKPEYSDILYNPPYFPGPLVGRISQVPLYIYMYIAKITVGYANLLKRTLLIQIVFGLL